MPIARSAAIHRRAFRLVSRGQFLGEYSDSSPLFFGLFPGVLSSGYLPRQFIERAQGLFVNNTSLSHRGEYLGNFWPKHRGGAEPAASRFERASTWLQGGDVH